MEKGQVASFESGEGTEGITVSGVVLDSEVSAVTIRDLRIEDLELYNLRIVRTMDGFDAIFLL